MAPYFGMTGGWLTFWVCDSQLFDFQGLRVANWWILGLCRLLDRYDAVRL